MLLDVYRYICPCKGIGMEEHCIVDSAYVGEWDYGSGWLGSGAS